MTQPEIPPLPDELLRRLSEPAVFGEVCNCPPNPGTIWEVCSPNGELLLFLIVQRIEADSEASFPFVRAVPLGDLVQPTFVDCAVVAAESGAQIYTAHCWLEGPVLTDAFVRCLGKVSPASMDAVTKARACQHVKPTSSPVAAFRESLYEQFDAVFAASWEKLYACLDQTGSASAPEADMAFHGVVHPESSQATANDFQLVLAAGGPEPSHAIIDRLASVSSADVSDFDYRRAWAHFLASTYRGTSCRDDWRSVFVVFTSRETLMDPIWMQRTEKAKALAEDRDWKRRYEGEKVFALEPVPLQNMSEFLNLLRNLAGSEAME